MKAAKMEGNSLCEMNDWPLKSLTIPYSDHSLNRLHAVMAYQGSFFQNIVFFNHNNFEITIFMEDFVESPQEDINNLSKERIQSIYVQSVAIFELARDLGLDFIDFSQFQLCAQGNIKFPVLLGKGKNPGIASLITKLNKNPHLQAINCDNYKKYYFKWLQIFKFCADHFYLYDYKSFSANLLNSHCIIGLSHRSNIKIKVKTNHRIQKRFIKNNLVNHLVSESVFLIYIDSTVKELPAFIDGLISKKSRRQADDFFGIISKLKVFLVESSFKSTLILIDELVDKRDIEFIKFLVHSSEIDNTTLIYFGEHHFIDFDLILKESPENLLAGYLSFDVLEKKTKLTPSEMILLRLFKNLSFPVAEKSLRKVINHNHYSSLDKLKKGEYVKEISGKIYAGVNFFSVDLNREKGMANFGSYDVKNSVVSDLSLNYCLNKGDLFRVKKILQNIYHLDDCFELENIRDVFINHAHVFKKDFKLFKIFIDILILEYDLTAAKKYLSLLARHYPSFCNLKMTYIYLLEKNYPQVSETFKKIREGQVSQYQNEYLFLKFRCSGWIPELRGFDPLNEIQGARYLFLTRLHLGKFHIKAGRLSQAEALIKGALQYFSQKNWHALVIKSQQQMAVIRWKMGDLIAAEKLLKNIYIKSEIRNYGLLTASIALNLGDLYLQQEAFKQADFWYHKGLEIFRNENNQYGIHCSLGKLVDILIIGGYWGVARKRLHKKIKFDEKGISSRNLALDYFKVARIEFHKHHFHVALEYLLKAISLFKSCQDLENLGHGYWLKEMVIGLIDPNRSGVWGESDEKIELEGQAGRILSLLKDQMRKKRDADIDVIIEAIQSLDLKVRQFEITTLCVRRWKRIEFLNLLRSLSKELSRGEKNYFYYEFYYYYFSCFLDNHNLAQEDQLIFNDVYFFFWHNNRHLSQEIKNFKNVLDERESGSDFFRKAGLVNDYMHWQVPEDFFNRLVKEFKRICSVDLLKLEIAEKNKPIFSFINQDKFSPVFHEMIQLAKKRGTNLNLSLKEVQRLCRCEEKMFYVYRNTKVILWKISKKISAVLCLAFLSEEYVDVDFSVRQKEFLRNYASLINRFYEYDYKMDEKLNFIIGKSLAVKQLKKQILKVSKVDFSVLIYGASGSGKELVAKAIHLMSHRNQKPFIPVNSAAIPEHLLEAELFGYRKGAFTGANESRIGLIEAANGGTLFLDEIADLPFNLQAKLLRVIQEQEIRRLGETRTIQVDIRLLSATNKDLGELIEKKQFRDDLYFRIQDLAIAVPTLQERLDDIPLLCKHFFKQNHFVISDQKEWQRIVSLLLNQQWPGNVRQLESTVKRIITYYPDYETNLGFGCQGNYGLIPARENLEKILISDSLRENNWNKIKTAASLRISRAYLFNLIKKYDIRKSG